MKQINFKTQEKHMVMTPDYKAIAKDVAFGEKVSIPVDQDKADAISLRIRNGVAYHIPQYRVRVKHIAGDLVIWAEKKTDAQPQVVKETPHEAS